MEIGVSGFLKLNQPQLFCCLGFRGQSLKGALKEFFGAAEKASQWLRISVSFCTDRNVKADSSLEVQDQRTNCNIVDCAHLTANTTRLHCKYAQTQTYKSGESHCEGP